ncbi:MAG: hypothetical protein HQ513_06645 [Rhodospirillales bacterium]|nr:hypothetical protein [Rhodospirillales bacterium]
MSQSDDDIIAADGRPVEQSLGHKSMKLPGKMGYGIAVSGPGRAIPYLLATFGQPVTRISEFKIFGFHSVIDLATPASTAALHRAETEAVDLRYFNIPIEGNMPSSKQSAAFKQIILNANNGPLLVYAPRAALIAVMWASYRLSIGSPLEFVLSEGKSLGLSGEQETELRYLASRSGSMESKE